MLTLASIYYCSLLAAMNDETRSWTFVIGLAAFAGGVWLLIRHKREIDEIERRQTDPHELEYEQRKFRRRSLASTMLAAMGVMLNALYWARDPHVYATLISIVLLLLLAVMFLASLDLMSVGLHSVATDDKQARKEMVEEYVRQREKLKQQVEESEVEES